MADVDDRDASIRCPLCARRLEGADLATPDVPTALLEDGAADVCARAYLCKRHRADVVAFEPASIAPDTFVGVDAVIDGEAVRLAVPDPVADQEGLA